MSVKVEVHNQIIAKFPLLALRSQNRQTGGSYFTKSCGYGAILISRDWIRRLVPLYFLGKGEIAPHFAQTWRCPHSPTCRSQTAQHMKTGEYYFERRIIALHFDENHASLFYTCWRKRGELVVQVLVRIVAVALLSFARRRRRRAEAPSTFVVFTNKWIYFLCPRRPIG